MRENQFSFKAGKGMIDFDIIYGGFCSIGNVMKVFEKDIEGWWYCELNGRFGNTNTYCFDYCFIS